MEYGNSILIIDDDRDFCDLVSRELQDHDFICTNCYSLEAGLEALKKSRPDLLLLDFLIADKTVYDFLDAARSGGFSRMPFVVMTGLSGDRRAVEIMQKGARDFIVKDDTFFELLPEVMKRVRTEIQNERRASTAEKARKLSHDRLINLVSQALEPAWIIDLNGAIIEGNDALFELLNCTESKHAQKGNLFDCFPGPDAVRTFKDGLHRHESLHDYGIELKANSGEPVQCTINARLFTDENEAIIGYQGFIKNVSEQKRWEHILKEHQNELEEKNARLEEVVQALKTFSDAIANDMRTPIWRLDGFCKMLQDKHAGELDEEGKFILSQIRNDGSRITQFINDAFRLSNVSRSEIERKNCDLSAIVENIFEDISTTSMESETEISIADGIQVTADESLLKIMLRMLLYYVWFYCQVCAADSLSIFSDKKHSVTMEIRGDNLENISDNSLFVPLYQAYLIKDYFQTGVSLVTVQRVIAIHGGRIWLDRDDNYLRIHIDLA